MLPSSDQSPEVEHGGSDVPHPDLQLLPQRLVGGAGQETVSWRAGLPLETQNHQDRLRQMKEGQKGTEVDGAKMENRAEFGIEMFQPGGECRAGVFLTSWHDLLSDQLKTTKIKQYLKA